MHEVSAERTMRGSREGWFEVYPGKKRCIYVRAYERLRSYREEEALKDGYIPPRDWDLAGTSSWADYSPGRDHQGLNSYDFKECGVRSPNVSRKGVTGSNALQKYQMPNFVLKNT